MYKNIYSKPIIKIPKRKRFPSRKNRFVSWTVDFKKLDTSDIDHDGVPNFRDCRIFNPRFHREGDIERARKKFGVTTDPHKGGWILPSGEMLDFSEEKLDELYDDPRRPETTSDRQIAHWEVGQATGLHGKAAIRDFEREGAIRYRKTRGRGMYAQMVHRPTVEQARTMSKALTTEPRPTFLVIERTLPRIKMRKTPEQQEELYLEADRPHPVIIQKFISRAFK